MRNTVLTINHQPFGKKDLVAFCGSKISDESTPPWEKAVYEFIQLWMKEDQTIVQFSSGTTGTSKKILLHRQSMIRSAEATCNYFSLGRGHTALLCLPVEYIAGKMMIVRSIVGQLNLQIAEPRSRPDLNGTNEIDFCAMVPLQAIHTFESDTGIPIRKLIVGGAEITPELEGRVRDVDTEVFATYGMAETCSHIAVRRINGPAAEPYYHTLPGIELGTDERGCLVVSADYLPDRIITNDQVQLADRHKFRWIGRFDNLINSSGIKIVPEEVESVMTNRTGLSCALIGLPDSKLGQRLIFAAEKKDKAVDDSRIRDELQKLIPLRILPEIVWIEKFPKNSNFKLNRKKLTEQIIQLL